MAQSRKVEGAPLAWRYRRSLRLPGGFRMNLSGRGVGYSWGFRGFRVSRDSRGRIVRTTSIPGTGLYNRQVVGKVDPQTDSRSLLGGCILFVICSMIALAVFSGFVAAPAFQRALWVVAGVIFLGLYLITRHPRACARAVRLLFRRSLNTTPIESASNEVGEPDRSFGSITAEVVVPKKQMIAKPQSLGVESLGHLVKEQFNILRVPVKDELRKSRGATAYEAVFEIAFTDIICRFGARDGVIGAGGEVLYRDIFGALHPRTIGGKRAVSILQEHLTRNPELMRPIKKPFLLRLIQESDHANGTAHSAPVAALMNEVARRAAEADGPLSEQANSDLDTFRDVLNTK